MTSADRAASQPAAPAQQAPAIVALADPARQTAARLGHQRIAADAKAPDSLMVCTGGAIASVFAAKDQPSAAVALADAAGYDAVNFAHRDLADAPDALARAIASAKTPFICATFHLSGAATPWHDFVVLPRGGQRVAFIGIAVRSASLASSPGSAKLVFTDPAAAIAAALPKLAGATRVIVLADATASDAAAWVRAFPRIDAVLLSGRGGGALRVPGQPRVYRAPAGGNAVALIGPDGGGQLLPLVDPAKPSDAYQQISSRFSLDPAPPAAVATIPPDVQGGPLAELPPGKIIPLALRRQNRAVELSVSSIALLDSFGGHAAPAGTRFLLIDTSWRNILTPAIVRDEQVPVAYKIPKLSDNLYCVMDASRVLPPGASSRATGLLSMGEMALPRPGSSKAGWLLYQIPAQVTPRELTLRFYDYAHGPIIVPLVGTTQDGADKPAMAGQPIVATRKNQVVEMGIFGMKALDRVADHVAPNGMHFVELDVRVRSVSAILADAIAYDPKASVGQKIEIGTVADWQDAHQYAQLVIDGQYAYAARAESGMPDQPRFLPDIFTGNTLVFLAPDGGQSMQLRCDFPNARLASNEIVRPEGLVFDVRGTPPAAAAVKPIASVNDAVFDVSIVREQPADAFAGRKPANGNKFLVLDVTVKNLGKQQEFFQPIEQLKYATEAGQQIAMDEATFAGPYPPLRRLYIPADDRRSFQAVYQIPQTDTRPRVAYAAVTEGASKLLNLPVITPADSSARQSVAGAPQIAQPAAPRPAVASAVPTPDPASASKMPTPRIDGPSAGHAPGTVSSAPAPGDSAKTAGAQTAPDGSPLLVTARQDRKPAGLAGAGITAQQVNEAIDKGAAGLWALIKKEDLKNASFGSQREHLLCALALVHADAHKKYPEFDAALRKCLDAVSPRDIGVYQNGILAMLIESYGDPRYIPKLRESARYLLESQGPEGCWVYTPRVPDAIFDQAAAKGAVLHIEGGTPIGQAPPVWTRIQPRTVGADGDNSVTQYALLGLSSASHLGMHMPADLWERSLKTALARQNKDGGWQYTDRGGGSYGSMSCAGICAVALARHELGQKDPSSDPSIERGLGWLSRNFSVSRHAGDHNPDQWYYYYIYSLERVGRILDTEFIGPHEWYPLGAAELIHRQASNGLWTGKSEEADPRLASSFALLFLTRATPPIEVAPKRGGNGTLVAYAKPPPNRLYIILDASGSMLDMMDGRMKFDIARGAVWSLVKDLPDQSQVALRVYGHRKRSIDPGADQDTQLLIPMGPLNKPEFKAKLDPLRSRGRTPLALSLTDALQDIGGPTDAKNPLSLVLLTDGGEDTFPRRDPVKAAAALAARKDIQFYIVGFDINQADWSKQLSAMAKASGGSYWPAAKSADLERALKSAVLGTPESFDVLDATGKLAARAVFGQPVTLPEGQYTFRATLAGHGFAQKLWINTDARTSVEFDGQAAMASLATAPLAQQTTGAPTPPTAANPNTPHTPKFCTNCGYPLKPGDKFCTHCGKKVEQ